MPSPNLGIFLVDQLSDEIETIRLDQVAHKLYRLPYQEKFVLIPMLNFDDVVPLI